MGCDHDLRLLLEFSLISSLVPGPVKLWPGRWSFPGNFDRGSLMCTIHAFIELVKSPPFCVLINVVLFDLHFQHFPTGSGYISSISRHLPMLHTITIIVLHLHRRPTAKWLAFTICIAISFLRIRIDFRPGICLSKAGTTHLLDPVVGPPEGSWMDCWLHLGKLPQQISKTRGSSVSIARQTDWLVRSFIRGGGWLLAVFRRAFSLLPVLRPRHGPVCYSPLTLGLILYIYRA